jgi:seryl-tRNA synthetase
MLTLKYITGNTTEVIARLAKKHFRAEEIIAQVVELDKQRKQTQTAADNALAQSNALSKEIGLLFKQGKTDEANAAKAKTVELKDAVKELTDRQAELEQQLDDLLLQIPNLPHESVPEGKHAEDNVIERSGGEVPVLPADAVPHWDLAKKYDLIDFELGVKISGAGFPVYKGMGARLQRALINFFPRSGSRCRISRSATALCGKCSFGLWYRSVARQRGSDVPCHCRRFVSHSNSRSSGYQYLPRCYFE